MTKRKLIINAIQLDEANFIDEAFNRHVTGTISIDFETCGGFSDMLDDKGKLDKSKLMDYLSKIKDLSA